jgi:serine/threonine-protein kinase
MNAAAMPRDAAAEAPASGSTAAPLQEGTRFGRYQLRERLGTGGMGVVYRALDLQEGRMVALKILIDPAGTARFDREARLQGRLDHPGIVPLIDSTEIDGRRCLVMAYAGGVTLTQYIRHRGRLRGDEAAVLFGAIAEAVGHLHRGGVVHCDLKSDNIKVLPDGQPQLLDFGIARDLHAPLGPASGEVAGTAHCLAPELLDGAVPDVRSDLWALGVLLYEMCTGRMPFDGTSLAQVLAQVRQAAPVPVRQLVPDLPAPLAQVIDGCLVADPARRWVSVEALLAVLRGTPAEANPAPVVPTIPVGAVFVALRDRLSPGGAVLTPFARRVGGGLGLALLLALGVWLAVAGRGGALAAAPWWSYPPEADLVALQRTGVPPRMGVRVDALGGDAEVWAGAQPLGRTPFVGEAPVGARVRLTLRWADQRQREIAFDVRDVASENAYTYAPPLP